MHFSMNKSRFFLHSYSKKKSYQDASLNAFLTTEEKKPIGLREIVISQKCKQQQAILYILITRFKISKTSYCRQIKDDLQKIKK